MTRKFAAAALGGAVAAEHQSTVGAPGENKPENLEAASIALESTAEFGDQIEKRSVAVSGDALGASVETTSGDGNDFHGTETVKIAVGHDGVDIDMMDAADDEQSGNAPVYKFWFVKASTFW